MKIYTYYDNIDGFDDSTELELIKVWEQSWSNQGYKPIVLTKSDAVSHSFYNEFCDKINNLHEQMMNKSITDYGLACYVRWLAYANIGEGKRFYVSDYDVINKDYPVIHPIDDKLHFMDSHCPCIASGNSFDFSKLCRLFINTSQKNTAYIRRYIQEPHYHDQEFFLYNYPTLSTIYSQEFIMTRSRPTIGCFNLYDKNHPDSKIFHIAHANIEQIKDNFPEIANKYSSDNKIRLAAAKDLL